MKQNIDFLIEDLRQEKLKMLHGSEIVSERYEGVVGVNGINVIQNGETVDTLDSDEKIDSLFDEMFQYEMGY